MLYVIKENDKNDKDAQKRNDHIDKTALYSATTFPNIFGTYVKNADEVKKAIHARKAGDQVLHIFAHGNQVQIGKFADNDNDSFAATDPLAKLLRDELKVF